jgi:uncharacterized protein (TIGR02996 family)
MIENQLLLSAILANPDDDRPRLVYADWLEQYGQLDRSRLIRVQIELERLPDDAEAAAALRVEEEQLEAACEKSLPQLEGIEWGSFVRGMVGSVFAATPAAFHRHADSIAAVGSVYRVNFQTPDGFAVLAETAALLRVAELAVCNDDHFRARNGDPYHRFNDDLQKVLTSAHCPRLRSLDLWGCQLGPRGAKGLADCPRLESLTTLNLDDNYIGDEGLAALAASPYLAALRKLHIDLNDLGPDGVKTLTNSVSIRGLEELCLGDSLGPSIGEAVGRSPYRTHFGECPVRDEIGAAGATALAQSPNLAGLTYLDLRCDIGIEGGRALAASPYLHNLKSLFLMGCWIGDDGADALARSPILANVEYLNLWCNDLTDLGAFALANSPYLACLKPEGLDFGNTNRLTEDGWQALRARYGEAIKYRSQQTPSVSGSAEQGQITE